MIISVASGKGGTGKTIISTSLALSLGEVQFLDCDVEEPNGHIFLKPQINERISVGIPVPEVFGAHEVAEVDLFNQRFGDMRVCQV